MCPLASLDSARLSLEQLLSLIEEVLKWSIRGAQETKGHPIGSDSEIKVVDLISLVYNLGTSWNIASKLCNGRLPLG